MSAMTFSHEPVNFRSMPHAIKMLILANAGVFLLSFVVGGKFYDLFGLVSQHVLLDRWVWQPVTYLFIHGNLFHLLFNVFALWMFGMPVEKQYGELDFLKYYFICGLGAAAMSLALAPHSTTPVIGASGSVYGLLVAFAMLYPDAVVYLYFLIPVKASHMAILFGLIEFFAGATSATPGVARFAPLGGMLTGYLYIRWWNEVKLRTKAVWRGWSSGLIEPGPRARRPSRKAAQIAPPGPEAGMDEVDRILDKILVSGLESLTPEEREVMRRYSDRMKH